VEDRVGTCGAVGLRSRATGVARLETSFANQAPRVNRSQITADSALALQALNSGMNGRRSYELMAAALKARTNATKRSVVEEGLRLVARLNRSSRQRQQRSASVRTCGRFGSSTSAAHLEGRSAEIATRQSAPR